MSDQYAKEIEILDELTAKFLYCASAYRGTLSGYFSELERYSRLLAANRNAADLADMIIRFNLMRLTLEVRVWAESNSEAFSNKAMELLAQAIVTTREAVGLSSEATSENGFGSLSMRMDRQESHVVELFLENLRDFTRAPTNPKNIAALQKVVELPRKQPDGYNTDKILADLLMFGAIALVGIAVVSVAMLGLFGLALAIFAVCWAIPTFAVARHSYARAENLRISQKRKFNKKNGYVRKINTPIKGLSMIFAPQKSSQVKMPRGHMFKGGLNLTYATNQC